jgi:SAM-dependent MidA family methyltransferase
MTLEELLLKEISEFGPMTFARFMELALYAPGLGYYSRLRDFGEKGDFITAPEISPMFAQCLAHDYQQHGRYPSVLEFGAGSGRLATDFLLYLEQQKQLPEHYYILELSAGLKALQQETLTQACPHLLEKVTWLDTLPKTPISAYVIANEILDAMPVHRFMRYRGECKIAHVDYQDGFHMRYLASDDDHLNAAIAALELPDDIRYESEINLLYPAWLSSLSDALTQARVVLIDYGFEASTFYHPQRHMGTLMCHYQHHTHPDPLLHIGQQDITAHVDFTAVMRAAEGLFSIERLQNQAHFLLDCGISDLFLEQTDTLSAKNALLKLTFPTEMGELFQVLVLEK